MAGLEFPAEWVDAPARELHLQAYALPHDEAVKRHAAERWDSALAEHYGALREEYRAKATAVLGVLAAAGALVTPPGQRAVNGDLEPCGYVSTACQHGLHERCRLSCKFCGSLCGCRRHGDETAGCGALATPDRDQQTRADERELICGILDELAVLARKKRDGFYYDRTASIRYDAEAQALMELAENLRAGRAAGLGAGTAPADPPTPADEEHFRLLESIDHLPVQFWACPIAGHSERSQLEATVEWHGGVAQCTAPGCGRTSADAPSPGPDQQTPEAG